MKTKIEQLKKELSDKAVDAATLALVLLPGGEQLICNCRDQRGENQDDMLRVQVLNITDPKRILRAQRMTQEGVSIEMLVGDLDLVSGGVMEVKPVGFAYMSWLDPEAQIAYMELYKEYLERRVINRAKEAGLEIPKGSLVGSLQDPKFSGRR